MRASSSANSGSLQIALSIELRAALQSKLGEALLWIGVGADKLGGCARPRLSKHSMRSFTSAIRGSLEHEGAKHRALWFREADCYMGEIYEERVFWGDSFYQRHLTSGDASILAGSTIVFS